MFNKSMTANRMLRLNNAIFQMSNHSRVAEQLLLNTVFPGSSITQPALCLQWQEAPISLPHIGSVEVEELVKVLDQG